MGTMEVFCERHTEEAQLAMTLCLRLVPPHGDGLPGRPPLRMA
jgi:hypothetical protein